MHSILFEHLKEDVTLFAKRKQIMAIQIDSSNMRENNLKRWASIFQAVIHFHPAICSQRHLLTVSVYWYNN